MMNDVRLSQLMITIERENCHFFKCSDKILNAFRI